MKDLKFLLVLLMLWFFGFTAIAQTELYSSPVSVNTETTFNLTVNLDNIEDVKAVQFDLNVDSEAVLLDSGHTLTQRAPDHSIAVNNVSPGVFRVIVYSMSGAVIVPGTGSLLNLSFVSKTLPGNFTGTFSNIVTSDINGEAVNTTSQSAMITVTGPLMDVVTKVVDFGRVPKGDNPTRTVNIWNRGNQTLIISAVNEIAPFSIQQTLPINIAPGQTTNLTLNINSSEKQQITRNLSFSSNDADPLRALQKVAISADIYAVNEIIIGSGSGEINTEISIPVVIKNMEPFTGFQFDISLPQDIAYVSNSISSTLRSNGHSFSANVINGNTLRFIAYSSSNNLFSGNDGEIFSFNLKPLVSSGIYSLPVSNAIISHPEMGDIVSDTYAGTIEIHSPNLNVNPSSIFLGNVPVTETRTTDVTFSNYGSASLIIDTILYDEEQLTVGASLPLEILPGANKTVSVIYHPNQTGSFSRNISIRHNGASEQNILQVSANAFSPNFLLVPNQQLQRNTSDKIEIDLVNHAPVKAIQFDMDVPAGFNLDLQNILKTERINNFSVSASEINPDKFRFVVYSSTGSIIPSGNSSILNLPVNVAIDVNIGTYSFNFTNLILSNSSNENTASIALETGSIAVVEDDTAPVAVCKNITVDLDETGNASITAVQIDNGSHDASGIASMDVNPSSFTTANLGDNSVTLSITDNNGNVSTCLSTVTIVDNISPTAVCQNLSVVLDETGQATITAEQVDNGSTDASGISSLELSKYSFTTDNIGDNLITLTVTDKEGNSSVCNSTINVTAPPSNYILVKSKEALLDQNNNIEFQLVNEESIKAIQFDIDLPLGFNLDAQNVSGTERVNGFSISVSLLTGNKYRVLVYSTSNYAIPLGDGTVLNFPVFLDRETVPGSYILDITGVILSDIDNQDASTAPQETGSITVADTIAPTAVCKNITLELDVNGNATVTPEQIDGGSYDNDSIATMEVSPNSFTSENLGENTVTLTVTDTSGNVNSCTAVITIEENSFISSVLYRINSGGPAITSIDGAIDWGSDTKADNSVYLSEPGGNLIAGSSISSYTSEVDLASTPSAIFKMERIDHIAGAPNMTYSFPVSTSGTYEVRLYMGNSYSGTSAAGKRIFDVELEGVIYPELDDIDLSARFGHQVGGMISRSVEVTDGSLDISFLHVKENPLINGIEILTVPKPVIIKDIPDLERFTSDADENIDLNNYFTDNGGVENLVYSVTGHTDPAVGAAISGNLLTLSYPSASAASDITIMATDADSNFVEQTFRVTVTEKSSSVLYRLNTGGPLVASIDGAIDWGSDTKADNSVYLSEPGGNLIAGSSISSYTSEVDLASTPSAIFKMERIDHIAGAPNMTYSFPVSTSGTYEVRLYMGNSYSGTSAAGKRIFDVELEGVIYPELDDIDLSARFGHQVGGMISRSVEVTDGSLDISFLHVKENPLINGIEILKAESVSLSSSPSNSNYLLLKDQRLNLGETNELEIQLLNDENIRAVQFDIKLPKGIALDIQNIKSTDRLNNFSVSTSIQGSNVYRVIAYSISKEYIPSGIGSILTLPITIGAETNLGTHPLAITSVLLSNMNNIDISTNALRVGEISVIDNILPSISCRDLEIELMEEGKISITAAQIDNGSHDIAGIASMHISKTVFTVENIGENIVTLTVTDKNGNTAVCDAIVFVVDNKELPIVICRNIEVKLDWKGEANITANQLDAGSSHPSGIAFTEISKNSFNIEDIGENVVTLKVTSNTGRIATCSATITVVPKVDIYPNPTSEVLNVGVFTNYQFDIYNVLGQPVQEGEVNEKNNRIPLKVKIPGTYFINFIKGDKKISKIFIIK
jgi:hypothetical protein